MPEVARNSLPWLLRHRVALCCTALLLATAFIYGQTIHHAFIPSWDDAQYIHNNPLVAGGLTQDNVTNAFTSFHFANWHPLTWLSHMLDVQVFGLNPSGHHVTNVLFHGLNSVLLFLLLFWLTGEFLKCAVVAGLFCVHPLHVESVAWISERKDLLSTFFLLLTLLSYVWYVRKPQFVRYGAVLAFFTLAMMSKQMVVTLPFLLLLLDAWPLNRIAKPHWEVFAVTGVKRSWRYLVVEKIPLFVVSVAGSAVVILAQSSAAAIQTVERFPIDVRVFNAINAYGVYLWKTIFPQNLSFLYPYHLANTVQILLSVAVLGAISYWAIKQVKRQPWWLMGWLWYLGTLVPVIGLVQVGVQPMADRYTYIPLIGIFVMLAWGLLSSGDLAARWRQQIAAVVVLVYAVVAYQQVKVWASSERLFSHAVQATANNDRAHALLAAERERQGQFAEAIEQARQAIAINPRRRTAYVSMGNSLRQLGKHQEAIKYYQKVLSLHPGYLDAQFQLASVYMELGQPQQAINWFDQLINLPDGANAVGVRVNYAIALEQVGRHPAALAQYRAAVSLDPQASAARYNLALLLEKLNQPAKAMQHYRQLLQQKPDHVQALNHLGALLVKDGRDAEAMAVFQQVLQVEPQNLRARQFISFLRNKAD